MTDTIPLDFDPDSLPTCSTCEQKLYGGSHYHCSCGTPDVTGMYGHHTSVCKLQAGLVFVESHHCGPDGDCDLTEVREAAKKPAQSSESARAQELVEPVGVHLPACNEECDGDMHQLLLDDVLGDSEASR